MAKRFFSPFRNRRIVPGQKVQVYRNLNRPGITYSIRDVATGLVLGHADRVLLNNCRFVVKESGRRRVLRTKKKNVHAYVVGHFGIIHAGDHLLFSEGTEVKYDPYFNERFVDGKSRPVESAGVVYISENGVTARGLEISPFF